MPVYPAGELKHGPLALIDKDMPVLALVPDNEHLDKIQSKHSRSRSKKRQGNNYWTIGQNKDRKMAAI